MLFVPERQRSRRAPSAICSERSEQLASWDVDAVRGLHAVYSASNLGTAWCQALNPPSCQHLWSL
jgi:hypothetical protein